MKLQTKLLLYFFSISLLIMIVGMIFYFQLRNLIAPLTPDSIPRNVEQLANAIDRNQMASHLKYQDLLVENELDHYLFARDILSLQKYYMHSAQADELLNQAKQVDPRQWVALTSKYQTLSHLRDSIIASVQSSPAGSSALLIGNADYRTAAHDFESALDRYFQQNQPYANEAAVVTVRLAVKNSYDILQKSLDTTLLIFLDAILASLILVFLSTRAIVQPINWLRQNLERMSISRLEAPVDTRLLRLKGEVGDLARTFADLFIKLRAATVLRDVLLEEIRRHKKTEIRLAETASRLQELNLDLDQFAYAASHDLRSPLKAIESLAQWIEEDCYQLLPEASRKNFDLIKKRVHRLNALIAGMLEYSRAGRETPALESVDLNTLLAEIIDNLAPPARIRIMIETILPAVLADRAKITQVFLNLFSNAIKYNDKKQGLISVGHVMEEGYYQFHVTDNGSGIDPAFHGKIFEIFQTLHPRDEIESSGIGLAIVKRIIEKNSGKIWLESMPGEGSTFYFTWPVKPVESRSELKEHP